jgi:energy-coupling factor transporter ATP-binding protein EcfA2
MNNFKIDHLKIKSFGPISEADVNFGDLTLLVGPQASGKSIFLQLFKLLIDKKHIRKIFHQYNYVWGKETNRILDYYFGEGLAQIWKPNTSIQLNGSLYTKKAVLPVGGRMAGTDEAEESLFYIPAQRILSISDGRPKFFTEFDESVPYVLRYFSETLRQMLQNGMGKLDSIFPLNTRLKEPLLRSFNNSIFHDGKIVLDNKSGQKKLYMKIDGMSVPFMTWSAGQKEFMPLLLGFYWLYPSAKGGKRENVKYVVIEEPEMGLHPDAIKSVILQVIDLISRGYKVIISTHSPVLLEFAWAFNYLKQSKAGDDAWFELFDIKKTSSTKRLFENIIKDKTINTYYFDRENDKVVVKNISSLDAGSEDPATADWGGLTNFATKAGDIVSKLVSDGD